MGDLRYYFVSGNLSCPGFHLGDFILKFNSYWFAIPGITLTGILAFIAFSFIISIVSSILYWIFK